MPESGRFPRGGHGNPFQYSCLENPMDRGAWRATVHRVAKSHKRLKQLSMQGTPVLLLLLFFTPGSAPQTWAAVGGKYSTHHSITDVDFQQGSVIYILLVKSDLLFSLVCNLPFNHLLGLWSCNNFNNFMSHLFSHPGRENWDYDNYNYSMRR